MTDHDRDVARYIALTEGLERSHIRCFCGRCYTVGITDELRELGARIKPELARRLGQEEIPCDSTRIGLCEID